jgi:hypothetical protein
MPEQARLHVFDAEGLAKEGILAKVDLTDGEKVRGAPIRVDLAELVDGSCGGGHQERVSFAVTP